MKSPSLSYFSQLKSTQTSWSLAPVRRVADEVQWHLERHLADHLDLMMMMGFQGDFSWWLWDFMVISGWFYGDFMWFHCDFIVISCDFIVISGWFHGDLMVILGFRWDSVRIYWYSIGFTYVIYWDFRGFGCDLLGFDGIDGNPLVFFNQCLWTGFDIASVPQIP